MSSKVIIITGSSRGMGKTMAELLLKTTSDKLVLVARSEDKLSEFFKSLSPEDQERVHFVAGDLTSDETICKLIKETISKFGKLNSVIFNAGVLDPISHIEKLDINAMKKLFDVNFFSIVSLTQACLPYLREAGKNGIDGPSSCIYVSSSASVLRYDGWLAYGASKAAINHLSMDLNAEESPLIRSISIDPGIVDTGMQVDIRENLGKNMHPDAHKKFIEFHERGNLLAPEIPGGVCANLAAIGIPQELSGEYLVYNDEKLKKFQYKI